MSSSKSSVRRSFDIGLRQYMVNIYSYMALGLGLTGSVAAAIGLAPLEIQVFFHQLFFLAAIGSFGIAMYFSFAFHRITARTAQALFWTYAVLMGVTLSHIFVVYRLGSVAQSFFVTALTFGGAALYGHTTKKDLRSMGSFLMMAVFGLIGAQIINMFFRSSSMSFALSALAVIIFTGLSAYNVQQMEHLYFQLPQDEEFREKVSIFGALSLYLNVVNIFLNLLRLTGERK